MGKNQTNFLILAILITIGILCLITWKISITPDFSPGVWIFIVIPTMFVLILIGLYFSNKTNLGLTFLPDMFNKNFDFKKIWPILKLSLLSGLTLAIFLMIIDFIIFDPIMPEIKNNAKIPSIFVGFFLSISAGINEEISNRFLLFTILFFILDKVFVFKIKNRYTVIFWITNILVALKFGYGHIHITKTFYNLDNIVIFRCFFLNGLASLMFGYLYFKKGLESAIIAHITTDIVIYVIIPLIAFSNLTA